MNKKRIFVVTLSINLVFLASNFAYNAALASDGNQLPSEASSASQTPQNSSNLAPGDSVKQEAQNWMQKAQIWLSEAAGKAYNSARQAAEQEISRLIDKQIKTTENQATTGVGGVVDIVKENIGKSITTIKIFFINLKNKIFQNNSNTAPAT